MQKDAPREVLGLSFSKFLVASDLSSGCPFPLTGQQKGWEVSPWLGIGITRPLLCVNLPALSVDVVLETVSFVFISVMFHTQPA